MDSFFEGIAGRWSAGRQDYHWHVLPPAGLVREHLTDPYQRIIAAPGLSQVELGLPPDGRQRLHPADPVTRGLAMTGIGEEAGQVQRPSQGPTLRAGAL